MAINAANRPKGRSVRSLRMVWGVALAPIPVIIAIAALALLVALRDLGSTLCLQADHRQRFRVGRRRHAGYRPLVRTADSRRRHGDRRRRPLFSFVVRRTHSRGHPPRDHRNLLRLSPGFFENTPG